MRRDLLLAFAGVFGGGFLGAFIAAQAAGPTFAPTSWFWPVTWSCLGLGLLFSLALAVMIVRESRYHRSPGLTIEFAEQRQDCRMAFRARPPGDPDATWMATTTAPVTGAEVLSSLFDKSNDETNAEIVRLCVRSLRRRPLSEVRVRLLQVKPTLADRQSDLREQAESLRQTKASRGLSTEELERLEEITDRLDHLDRSIASAQTPADFLSHRDLLMLKWKDDDPASEQSRVGRRLDATVREAYMDFATKIAWSPAMNISCATDHFRDTPLPADVSYQVHVVGYGRDEETGRQIPPCAVAFELGVGEGARLAVTPKSLTECGFQ